MIVQIVPTDMKFGKTLDELLDRTVVNTSAAMEHVTKIECQSSTTKEHCCAIVSTLSFEVIPKLIVTNILFSDVLWLDTLPV